MDDDSRPAGLAELEALAPETEFTAIDADRLLAASEIVVSPGVPLAAPALRAAAQAGIPITGDVALFAEAADAPVIAITGSNGKSTVTALVGGMARQCGVNAGVGGNIGTPCLDLLEQGFALYVIEVSSYQLEAATHLDCRVGVLLNLSPDHLDRYAGVDQYYRTKASIYRACQVAVINRDIDYPLDVSAARRVISFGAAAPATPADFGMRTISGTTMLCRGETALLAVDELPMRGAHNHLNALAGLAIGSALDWQMQPMIEALRNFHGLPHRCEWIADVAGVTYINDSKSTNIGSTLAALRGLATGKQAVTLILGGRGKGADFSVLAGAISDLSVSVYVYGADREIIAGQLGDVPLRVFATLAEVMDDVFASTRPGELVLFSPGCASLDQFRNFEARGEAFRSLVEAWGKRA